MAAVKPPFRRVKAETWVLTAMIITAGEYLFRYVIEGVGGGSGSKLKRLTGSGPVPPLETWLLAYGLVYTALATVAVGAPELAAALAILIVVTDTINNGGGISRDLATARHASTAPILPGFGAVDAASINAMAQTATRANQIPTLEHPQGPPGSYGIAAPPGASLQDRAPMFGPLPGDTLNGN